MTIENKIDLKERAIAVSLLVTNLLTEPVFGCLSSNRQDCIKQLAQITGYAQELLKGTFNL